MTKQFKYLDEKKQKEIKDKVQKALNEQKVVCPLCRGFKSEHIRCLMCNNTGLVDTKTAKNYERQEDDGYHD